MRQTLSIPLLATTLLLLASCDKKITDADDLVMLSESSASTSSTVRLTYADSVYYLRGSQVNYIVAPRTKPSTAGYFKAIPAGLVMDTLTGSININRSEPGLRYKIFYISQAGRVLDSTRLVVSGIDYADGIYAIASTPNAYDTAFPIYNARPGFALPCTEDDDDDDDDAYCIFDETDLNRDGNDDIAGVIQDKLLIDEKKGTIDLEASFHAGIFGSSAPPNGVSRDFTFYYRLNDASNMALNKITVRVIHYRTRRDIPKAMLETLRLRAEQGQMVNRRNTLTLDATAQQQYLFTVQTNAKPRRPPLILLVSM